MNSNCNDYLQNILDENELTLSKIYTQSLIKQKSQDFEYKGIFLNKCKNLEKRIFQIYKYLTKNTPIAQNIILCNKKTTIEELTAFLYRSILCEFNSCFIIACVELLEFDKKSKLIELLNKIYVEDDENMKSCLIILYSDITSDIVKSLESLKHKKYLNINENEINSLEKYNSNVEIILSDQCGVGKSTQIKLEIEKANKKYIYFPLGGVFNKEDIISRLKNLQLSKDCSIHLDLYDTDEVGLMNEFLFSILITKIYGKNEELFCFLKEIDIKIEIPNGVTDFMGKFPILTLFPYKKLSIDNLAPLIVSDDITSNVQIVSNYLKVIKEDTIEIYDLYFDKISYKYIKEYKTAMIAEQLSQNECQKLIFDEIGKTISKPNYYHISSFIDILGTQLIKFNRNYYFLANTLKDNSCFLLKKIRTFTIKSLIQNSLNFIEGSYQSILNRQQLIHKILFRDYEQNEDFMLKINLANKDQIFSFRQIVPSLFFFHEGNDELFSIITNTKKNDQEYINLLEFLKYKTQNKRVDLPDYTKYSNLEFLDELKNILNIKNELSGDIQLLKTHNKLNDYDVEEEEEENITENRKSLEEITHNYVFTRDNFIKMLLIILRIRANIPVIMMGETGCGKTSLIIKLSELLNNGSSKKLKILNIHEGMSDKDIIGFLEKKVIKQALKIEEKNKIEKAKYEKNIQDFIPKKLWVFLDEINRCKSMGLITELICKHSYQGKPLPSNIIFIAACKPYRLFNNTLIYNVNALPDSLLNFVINFGYLEKEDEEMYIEKIIYNPIYKIYYQTSKENFENKKGNKKEIEFDFREIHKLAKDLILAAHNFIREKSDISSISLRDIGRFNIFYGFFFDYLKKKKRYKSLFI